jgi:hypothetical protein
VNHFFFHFLLFADEGECQSAEDEGIQQDSGEAKDSAAAVAAALTLYVLSVVILTLFVYV